MLNLSAVLAYNSSPTARSDRNSLPLMGIPHRFPLDTFHHRWRFRKPSKTISETPVSCRTARLAIPSDATLRLGRLAGVGLAGGAVVSFAILAAAVYLAFTGQRQFASPLAIFLYYVIPATTTVLLLAALKLPPVTRLRLLLSCLSVAAALYALELVVNVSGTRPLIESPMSTLNRARDKQAYAEALSKRVNRAIDPRSAREVLADFAAAGVDAVPIVTPSNHLFTKHPGGAITSAVSIDGTEVVPLAAVANRLTLLCNESGEWVHYRADGRGFNNPKGQWEQPIEIAALGDSFVQGYCVPPEKNFVALIRQRRPATLNLGVAGDGPLLMLATLQEHLSALRPKTVLWFYFEGNDLLDLQTERRNAVLRNYLNPGFGQPLLSRQDDIDRAMLQVVPQVNARQDSDKAARRWNTVKYSSLSFFKLTALRERIGIITETDAEILRAGADLDSTNTAVFRDVLTAARSRVDSWSGRLVFVYLPGWTRYAGSNSPGDAKREQVLSLVRELGIPLIDLHPAFQAQKDPLDLFPFRLPGHYTEAGHRLVASEVLSQLAAAEPGAGKEAVRRPR
jgi:lysophospholipase L1-like esterase